MSKTTELTLTENDIDVILDALKSTNRQDDLYRAKMQYARTPTESWKSYIEAVETQEMYRQQVVLKITAGMSLLAEDEQS